MTFLTEFKLASNQTISLKLIENDQLKDKLEI